MKKRKRNAKKGISSILPKRRGFYWGCKDVPAFRKSGMGEEKRTALESGSFPLQADEAEFR